MYLVAPKDGNRYCVRANDDILDFTEALGAEQFVFALKEDIGARDALFSIADSTKECDDVDAKTIVITDTKLQKNLESLGFVSQEGLSK